MFNAQTGKYEIKVEPAFEPFPHETEVEDAREMNGFIERSAYKRPEQYMWVLRLLLTQQHGQQSPYRKFDSNHPNYESLFLNQD
jgi:lauroyl-KDO2-lipid IV(A) myristoyltransferase